MLMGDPQDRGDLLSINRFCHQVREMGSKPFIAAVVLTLYLVARDDIRANGASQFIKNVHQKRRNVRSYDRYGPN
jgi:lipoate synthase